MEGKVQGLSAENLGNGGGKGLKRKKTWRSGEPFRQNDSSSAMSGRGNIDD